MDVEDRLAQAEADIARLANKAAAVQWVVEQLAGNFLADHPDADDFLDALARDDGRARVADNTPISDADREAAMAAIRHLVERIRHRVHDASQ